MQIIWRYMGEHTYATNVPTGAIIRTGEQFVFVPGVEVALGSGAYHELVIAGDKSADRHPEHVGPAPF